MEFSIEKCAMFIMKRRKRQITEGIELLNRERIRKLKKKLQVLGNIGSGHQTNGDEKKKKKKKKKKEKSTSDK